MLIFTYFSRSNFQQLLPARESLLYKVSGLNKQAGIGVELNTGFSRVTVLKGTRKTFAVGLQFK